MILRVLGEYESIDAAELASGKIREAGLELRKISIVASKQNYRKTTEIVAYPAPACTETFTLLTTGVTMQNYMTEAVVTEHSPAEIPEPELRESVTLQVLCDAADADQVRHLMTATGGSAARVMG